MTVAIRAITRVQDADDVPLVGAGQNGHALTWNNATGAFVATALVADHGALTGLGDDDHAQYLLATGARTGASSQAQTFTNGVIAPTLKPAADSTTALQLQTASGTAVVTVDTTNQRFGIGTPVSVAKLTVMDGITGRIVLQSSTESGTDISYNLYSGANVGAQFRFIESGSQTIINASRGGSGANLQLRINDNEKIRVTNSGSIGVGTTAPATLIHGLLTSTATNAVTNVVTIGHDTSGTAAAGFGAGLAFQLESSTTAAQDAALISSLWYEATHATRKADLVLSAYDTAVREGVRIRGNGSAAALGFYGVTPIERALLATGVGATVDNVIAALQNLGLVKQS